MKKVAALLWQSNDFFIGLPADGIALSAHIAGAVEQQEGGGVYAVHGFFTVSILLWGMTVTITLMGRRI